MWLLRNKLVRAGAAVVVIAVLLALFAKLEIGRDWKRLNVAMMSGAPEGRYHAVVDEIAAMAAQHNGTIKNVTSAGSVENLTRLVAASTSHSCDVAFALMQDGQDWPASSSLELIGRLPRAESLLLLGKDADHVDSFASLAGKRIAAGPAGSGTAKVVADLVMQRDIASLGVVVVHASLADEVEAAARGEIDLAAMVIDERAPLVEHAVRDLGLQVASFPHAEVVVGNVKGVHVGRIAAGRYDAVRVLPPSDRVVLQVDTLVVGNGCASRSRTTDVLDVLAAQFPEFIRTNQHATNDSGLALSSASQSFFENGGPDAFDEYAPWLVDVMPPGKWVYLITAVSLLLNVMGFGNRFQLWRIDAARVQLEREITRELGRTTTLGDINRMQSVPPERGPDVFSTCERVIRDLEALAERSRKQSLSILVPMGQEMAYRYQEEIIHETLAVLRGFLSRARTNR
jgi:TRAP-type uncharacterized transport system substrate-binding protein